MSCPNGECANHVGECCIGLGEYAAIIQTQDPEYDALPTEYLMGEIFRSFEGAKADLVVMATGDEHRASEADLDIAANWREFIAELEKQKGTFSIQSPDDHWWRIESGGGTEEDSERLKHDPAYGR